MESSGVGRRTGGAVIFASVGETRTETDYLAHVQQTGNFLSQSDLRTRILDCIDYFNRTMAKPFQWTYKGKALTA